MYKDLETALLNALEYIRAAREPSPVPLVMSLEDMTREACKIGGDGTHVELTCRIGRAGQAKYAFTIWDGVSRRFVTQENQQQAMLDFAAKCQPPAPEPEPTSGDSIESVVLGQAVNEAE